MATDAAAERTQLIDRAQALANEIASMFADTDHWNRAHPDEKPLDPDPDGSLERLYNGLAALLRRENVKLVESGEPHARRRLVRPLIRDPQPTPDAGGEGGD